MKYKDILQEYRRGGAEHAPKISAWDQLEKYKDMDNVYISFTALEKLGINPQSKYDTPIGIYCYPLKQSWKFYDIEYRGIRGFPFAEREPNIWIFQCDTLQDLRKYTPTQLKNDIEKLKTIYLEKTEKDEESYSQKSI